MNRRLLALVTIGLFLITSSALAASPSEAADDVSFRGYYIEPGIEVDIDVMEELAAEHDSLGFVAVADTGGLDADEFARDVLDIVGTGTIVVLTPDEVGATSFDFGDDALSAALGSVVETTGDDYETDFEQFANAITGGSPAPADPDDEGSGGGGGFPWFLVFFVGGGALLIWFLVHQGRRQQSAATEARLAEARAEIQEQMAVIANEILEFSDRDSSGHPDAVEHFRKASERYRSAEGRLAASTGLADLEALADDLDMARWELEAAEAMVEGREPPPQPEEEEAPQPCFFDPTHKAGTVEAEIQTPAGSKKVWVCRLDAQKLRRGEQPEPRQIQVNGRSVPAPQAPRSHGGLGMDWMDVFAIIVGGMAQGASYQWGRPRTRAGSSFRLPGGFGGGGGSGGMGRARASRSMGRARRRR